MSMSALLHPTGLVKTMSRRTRLMREMEMETMTRIKIRSEAQRCSSVQYARI